MKASIQSKELADEQYVDVDQITHQFHTLESLTFKQLPRTKTKQKSIGHNDAFTLKQEIKLKPSSSSTEEQLSYRVSSINSAQQSGKQLVTHISRTSQNSNLLASRKSYLSNQPKIDIAKKRKKWMELKDVITNQKVQALKDAFINKIRRNNPYSTPIEHSLEGEKHNETFLDHKGVELKEWMQKILSLLSIINIISSIFIYTLALVFSQIRTSDFVQIIQIMGLILYLIEIGMNLIVVRFSLGRKLQNIGEISLDYIKHKFIVDFLNIVIISINLVSFEPIFSFMRLITFLKISDCLQKMQKLQVYFIQNYYNQQYWSLVKVFLFNFCFAHLLAIILIAMCNVNPSSSWMVTKGINNSSWYQKYIWSYYWATTIMLTIGFGDMVPVSYQQACCMIFIQTISCIVLAYNINCVGSLISNIRSQDIQKSKSLKIFKKLADKHHISQSLNWKINNYIEEHTNIKKLFNIEEEVQFVSKLPTAYRMDYLKEANKTIFQKLFFFNHLMQKTLFSLAQKIEMKITHPQQIILNSEKNFDLLILKNGQIGYTSRKINRSFNKYVFDRLIIKQNDQPLLLHTNFITKERSSFGIKSIVYSVIYFLEYQQLIDTLRETHIDYELYCQMKDKNKNKLDQFQVYPCQYCTSKHTKFTCPKLHFMPIHQHVINKYIVREKYSKNNRISSFQRIQTDRQSSLINYLFNKQIYAEKKQAEKQSTIAVTKKLKKQNFVIDQLRAFQNAQNDSFQGFGKQKKSFNTMKNVQALTKMQSKFLQNTTEIIKIFISKASGLQKGEDQVFTLDLDRLKNYKDYFNEGNPINLQKLFSVQTRVINQTKNDVFEVLTKCISDDYNSYKLCQKSQINVKTESQVDYNIKQVSNQQNQFISINCESDFNYD